MNFPTVALNADPKGVTKVFLSSQEENNNTATILGWGITESGLAQALKMGQVSVLPGEACQSVQAFAKVGAPITNTMICAEGQPVPATQVWPALPAVDACQGDSGGPFLFAPLSEDLAKDIQYGTVSFGVGCGKPGVPGVYTDVSQAIDFITETVKNWGVEVNSNNTSSAANGVRLIYASI